MNNTTTVYAGELQVGDELLYDGEVISIEQKGDYINVIAAGNATSINLHLHDDVTIYERIGTTIWVLSRRDMDDGWKQIIATFEDPADAMIYADNEVDWVELVWGWMDLAPSNRFKSSSFRYDKMVKSWCFVVEPVMFYASTD